MNVEEKNLLTLNRMTSLDESTINNLLNDTLICLSIPENPSNNEWVTAKTTINLLARLYSRIYLQGNVKLTKELQILAKNIRSSLSINRATPNQHFDVLLAVGNESGQDLIAKQVIRFDSDGWIVRLTRNQPHFIKGHFYNPLAAAAVACFAANELFKILFSPFLNVTLADQFTLSLLNYSVNIEEIENDHLYHADVGEVWLAGAGAVGNGFLYGLSLMDTVNGMLNISDNREITESNLQRYILTKEEDIGKNKTEVAARALSIAKPFQKTIQDCIIEEVEDRKLDTLVCAVDTIETRKELQSLLPRLIINGWTRMDEFAVTKHEFDSEYRCLSCLYDKLPRKEKSEIDNLVEQIGFSHGEVLNMIRGNVGLTRDHIKRIAQYRNDNPEKLTPWIGRAIQSFYHEAICGGISLNTDTGEETVPLAHISALTGILLAIELIKEKMYRNSIKHKMQFHMLKTPNKYLLQPELKSPNSTCICSDEDYLSVYRNKWMKVTLK
ncbi:ThiF family adenylyltransferase [Pseudoneobacillus rhizosphaerae]|uniref:THIF-type NAD/FAD binding fold domain-containing protein n=1 Tax=Pseudoneobacillus rhizosphaerae TaxID=2880968 RepID=A0A9C7LCZ4_9BACI|nr:ThiF family adenylyltransferase [Pseudoneobacillus rhizosphaerae]CAG9610698.1 hypothetical protein NEOCIP111885_04474 [Pseudoneobacillus rhizosphaerae]